MPSTYPTGGTDKQGFREPRYDEVESPKCPVEQLSAIHEATIRTLTEAYGLP